MKKIFWAVSYFFVSAFAPISPIIYAHSASAQSLIATNQQITGTGYLPKPEKFQAKRINAVQFHATFQTSSKEPTKKDIDTALMKRGFPKSDYPYYEAPNGCTFSPDSNWFNSGTGFKPACDNHDRCYETVGKSKEACDNTFKADMDKICATGTPVTGCSATATSYYKIVANISASLFYSSSQTEAKKYQVKVEEFKKEWKQNMVR